MMLEQALREFLDFTQDLPLVTFNAQFDMAFLLSSAKRLNTIDCYQANVRDSFGGNYPYDRPAVIFRRRRDFASEMTVLSRAVEVFSQLPTCRSDVAPKLEKFRKRLDRACALSKKVGAEPPLN